MHRVSFRHHQALGQACVRASSCIVAQPLLSLCPKTKRCVSISRTESRIERQRFLDRSKHQTRSIYTHLVTCHSTPRTQEEADVLRHG